MTGVSTNSPAEAQRQLQRVRGRRHIDRLKEQGRALVSLDLPIELVSLLNNIAQTAGHRRSLVAERLLRHGLMSRLYDNATEADTSTA